MSQNYCFFLQAFLAFILKVVLVDFVLQRDCIRYLEWILGVLEKAELLQSKLLCVFVFKVEVSELLKVWALGVVTSF